MAALLQFGKHLFSRGKYGGVATKQTAEMGSYYGLTVTAIDGTETDFKKFDGKVTLVTNVASF